MATHKEKLVIIGSGQAAIQLAASLRQKKYDGRITMIGDEPYSAYQRPPLSKAFLKGEMEEARLFLKPQKFYDDKDIELLKGARVERVDTASKEVTINSGASYSYDKLVFATGTRPRMIPELEGAENVQVMRTLDDAKTLKAQLDKLTHVTIVGGGYIGLEAAAVLRKMGVAVDVLERMPRLLARVTGDEISDYFKGLHEANGVNIRLEAEVRAYQKDENSIIGIKLNDGKTIKTDLVLVGIGVLPNQEIAAEAGIEVGNGIIVDENCETSASGIYAIGDNALRPLEGQTEKLRLESVPNAIDMAETAARHILGLERPAYDPPWFWSDQYDTKIQTVGLFSEHTETFVRGDVAAGKFSVFYFKGETFIAVDSVNDPQSFMACKNILKMGLDLIPEAAQDQSKTMMDIFKELKTQKV